MLIIRGCPKLQRIPKSIKLLKNLKQMSLDECHNLKALPEEFCCLQLLEHLQLSYCDKLLSLPSCFGELRNLRHLELSYLKNLRMLPDSFKQLINLQTLKIKSSPISELDFGRGAFTSSLCNLENIFLEQTEVNKISISEECCPRLKIVTVQNSGCLREVDTLPTTVEQIEMMECPELVEFLSSVKLTFLILFTLDGLHKIEKIVSLQHCTSLKHIYINDCPQLNVLSNFAKLASLKAFHLHKLHKIEKIEGLQHCTSLEALWIHDCPKLNVLPCFENFTSLEHSILQGLHKIEKIEGLQHCISLRRIVIQECPKLNVLSNFAKLASLKVFQLHKLHKIEKIEGLQHCTSLEGLWIDDCPKLNVLPCFENFTSLENSILLGLHKIEKIEGLQHCTSLRRIIIKECPMLNLLLEKLVSLRVLTVTNCNKLENREGIQQWLGLDELVVENTCWGVPSIESLGQMQGLGTPQLDGRCIPKMKGQKWPRQIIIRRKVVPGTGSFLNSSDFPNLSLLHSFANKTITDNENAIMLDDVIMRGKSSSNDNENAIMLCLVINCLSPHTTLHVYRTPPLGRSYRATQMEEGKWIWIGIFTRMETGEKFFIRADVSQNRNEVEKGMVLKGKVNNVAEAFWRIVARLGN